jgi:hypothetical protein
LVVVPRSSALQQAEDRLSSLAMVALVLGNRPPVSTAMVRAHLSESFGIGSDRVSVHRFWPDDFIARFRHREDLDMVLGTPPPLRSNFALRWRPWSRLSMASVGPFRFRALVGMRGIPAHARAAETVMDTVQFILGSSCARVHIADDGAVGDPDDERELFVSAWCAHPDLIPDEKIIAIPEREEEHDGGPPSFLRREEMIHHEVPALRYLVRLRIVEYQDWHTPPPSDDEGFDPRDDEDSDDSNCNGFHPGFQHSGGGGARPRTTRFGRAQDPRLQRNFEAPFQRRQAAQVVTVGQVRCPVASGRPEHPGRAPAAGFPALGWTRVVRDLALEVDLGIGAARSLSPVRAAPDDPMCAEAELGCTAESGALAVGEGVTGQLMTIDRDPNSGSESAAVYKGLVGRSLDEDLGLMVGQVDWAMGPCSANASEEHGHVVAAVLTGPVCTEPGMSVLPAQVDAGLPVQDLVGAPDAAVVLTTTPVGVADMAVAAPVVATQSVDEFISELIKPLPQTILSTPSLRSTRDPRAIDTVEWLPKRSARLAAKSRFREEKPDKQARKILMRKLGYDVQTEHPDEATFQEFHDAAFKVALVGEAEEAMQVLLRGGRANGGRAVRAA